MNNLAAAFSILSQGTPFMQAGEEMLRTKPDGNGGFDDNSYRAPDAVNALKWQTLSQDTYQKNVDYYRGLLAFRKAHPGLHLLTREAVTKAVHPVDVADPYGAAFVIEEPGCEIFVLFNAGTEALEVSLPEGTWEANIHDATAGTMALFTAEKTVQAAPISATVLTKVR